MSLVKSVLETMEFAWLLCLMLSLLATKRLLGGQAIRHIERCRLSALFEYSPWVQPPSMSCQLCREVQGLLRLVATGCC